MCVYSLEEQKGIPKYEREVFHAKAWGSDTRQTVKQTVWGHFGVVAFSRIN